MLIFIAVTFTWLMGLMGYVRSGLKQHWHVYGVIRDNSPDAFTPTLGFATQVEWDVTGGGPHFWGMMRYPR